MYHKDPHSFVPFEKKNTSVLLMQMLHQGEWYDTHYIY